MYLPNTTDCAPNALLVSDVRCRQWLLKHHRAREHHDGNGRCCELEPSIANEPRLMLDSVPAAAIAPATRKDEPAAHGECGNHGEESDRPDRFNR